MGRPFVRLTMLSLEQQKRHVEPGEFILLDLEDIWEFPQVRIKYPLGFEEVVPFERFEKGLGREPFRLPDLESRIHLTAFLTNYRRTAYFPSSGRQFARVSSPEGNSEIFV